MTNEIDPNAAPLPGYEKPRTDHNLAREFLILFRAAMNDPEVCVLVREESKKMDVQPDEKLSQE